MVEQVRQYLRRQLDELRSSGLYKQERELTTPQNAHIGVPGRESVLNLCANNYLGLASHPDVIAAAAEALKQWGYGLASVRFICGTQRIHKQLERTLSEFLGTDDTILYSSCFDANAGLFETLLAEQDAVISDELNHASIIDGIRLCKAQRLRYRHADMADLETQLKAAGKARYRLVATDGVFSMDGDIAKLPQICALAEKYESLVMVDDSHAVGVLGKGGRGSHEHHNVMGRVDIITGTLGKALGGASGGYTSGRAEIVEWLRQRSRPYLFSNSVAPHIVATSMKVLELISTTTELQEELRDNARFFRDEMTKLGFKIVAGEHPIVPIMLGDAKLAVEIANRLLDKGVYVIAFSYPVVPKNTARLRVQLSAAHSRQDLQFALDAFAEVKKELRI